MEIFKKVSIFIISVLLIIVEGIGVSAEQIRSSDSFTHQDIAGGSQITVAMPDVFTVKTVIDARTLGIGRSYGTIVDIHCDEMGNCYILSEEGEIIEFDNNFNFVKYHTAIDTDGESIEFAGAQGIFATGNEIYVADTLNGRVICFEKDSNKLIKEIVVPDSALIPSGFVFSPTKLEKSSKGYIYVISEGSYYGALLYSPEGEFLGFYGANTVNGGVLSTLQYVWDSITSNDTKRAKKVKKLPYQFVDIFIDQDDFVYTCTGLTSSSNATGQLRMLSPGGTNILYKRQYNGGVSDSSSFSFGEKGNEKRNNKQIKQNFASIQVDENGFIYALDRTYGLIYVYDTDCNLITAFGGGRTTATQKGLFTSAKSLALNNGNVYVADSLNNNVTVFSLTDFGKVLLPAQKKMLDAKYTECEHLWKQVLENDANNRLALKAMAKIHYLNGDYDSARSYAKASMDYAIYAQSLKQVQTEFIKSNFTWIFFAGILFVAVLIAAIVYIKKKKIKFLKTKKFKTFLNGFIHPFDAYNSIRYEDMGSLKIAITLTFLFLVSSLMSVLFSDFRFTSFNSLTFNALFVVVRTVGLILLWSVANWGVSVLLQGIGKLKHVFITTAYSTLPIIVCNFITIPLSYLITSPSSTIISGLNLIAMIWTGVVLTIGLMVVHNFMFPRFVVSVVAGLFFMFLIVFVLFIFGILITQFGSFAFTIFMEFIYR